METFVCKFERRIGRSDKTTQHTVAVWGRNIEVARRNFLRSHGRRGLVSFEITPPQLELFKEAV